MCKHDGHGDDDDGGNNRHHTSVNNDPSSPYFDDDFAEASIEAISLAALRTKPQTQPPANPDHTFPLSQRQHQQRQRTAVAVSEEPLTPSSTLRRLLSSLLPVQTALLGRSKMMSSSRRAASSGSGSITAAAGSATGFPPPAVDLDSAMSPTAAPGLALPAARVHLVYPDPHNLWHLHVLSLPHNALRAELIDLCAMLHALCASAGPPFHLLQEWFTHFASFVLAYLEFEDSVLMPWAYAGVDDARLVDFRHSIAPERALIAHLVDELANALSLATTRPAADVLPLLVRAVRDLVGPVLSYLEREQRVLPNLIQARRTRNDAVNVERVMAKRLDVGLLLRWVPSRSYRLKLRFKLLTLVDMPAFLRPWRSQTARHLAIVRIIVGIPQPT